ncbi:flavin-containing monooxygenase [Nocardia aobensis]|uniref:Flavin-containing monooxygenase n=1 Tax=Nocardia aobensis TaxID=257277 RepID=A0ABW6NZI8_9NOCA
MNTLPAQCPSVLIVGAGFAGLAAAIELSRHGYTDVTILERAAELGGTWRENHYPGAACDVPSPLYSYSFAPNPEWTQRFAGQAEILAYMRRTAADFAVDRLIHYDTEVTAASFDERRARWRVDTSTGKIYEADVLVPAVGVLSLPAWPKLSGMNCFTGAAFHSAQWDHSVDLTGKRVAVIGTGASAVQFVPQVREHAAEVTVFQRTAPWIVPRPQRVYTALHHRLFRRMPASLRAERELVSLVTEGLQRSMTSRNQLVLKAFAATSKAYLRYRVADPALRAKLTPDYPAGCKRILFDAGYLQALTESNVEVVTDAIAEITPGGIRTVDGAERDVDVIIYGTGFAATEVMDSIKVHGVDGRLLSDAWSDGARAYFGMCVPGFPNLFFMYGPNTSLGSGSIIGMLEPQARYLRRAVEYLDDLGEGATVDVRAEVEQTYDAEIQSRVIDSVWTTCSSWYRNAAGRVVANWPGSIGEYARRTARFDPSDYHVASTVKALR